MKQAQSLSVLILGYVWPEPGSSAAGKRMMELIDLFQGRGWNITFASSAAKTEYMVNLEHRNIEMVPVKINNSEFDQFLDDLQPDIVMFDRFVVEEQFGWRVAEHCPQALRILDMEDLHALRRTRQKAVNRDRNFMEEDLLAEDVAKREIASILRCDLSLVISTYEMELLENLFGISQQLLHYLPFILKPIDESVTCQWTSFEERKHFVTIGNFRHPPNWDSVQYLKQKVWPLVRKELPESEMHIYGAYPSKKVTDLHAPEDGLHIKGRAEDAKEVVQRSRVCLAPLRFGAGLKGKLVEAMQCGTPSVTTPVGAEGLNGDLEWPGAIAEGAGDLASSAVHLYRDREVWSRASKQGIAVVNQRFSREKFEEKLIDKIIKVLENIEEHRLHNFMGSMLMHHTMASTRYMAKWIEAKNS